MTDEIGHEEDGFMSVFYNSQRRCRRNGLCHIFEGYLEEEERISFQNRLITSASSTVDENGDLVNCTSSATSDSNCCHPRKDADFPGSDDHSDERERLSGLTAESTPPSMETARPSCLVGLKSSASSSNSSSSSSSSSSSPVSASSTSPSSMSSQTCSSASSISYPSFSGEGKVQACSPNDNTSNTLTHGGFTTSPSTSSLCYDMSFSRVRRNALHDLLETLTQDDLEKLKNLYQTALSTAFSVKPFSEQTQSPIRGFHECKA